MFKQSYWNSRLGFYLAAIGTSCGLGNLWRFPYVAGENGGGAFVLIYVILALVLGLPLLIGELIIGKTKRQGVVKAFSEFQIFGFKVKALGFMSVGLSLFILCYYAVISGWVLFFAIQFFLQLFQSQFQSDTMSLLMNHGYLQVGLASVHLIFVGFVVFRGLQDGIEQFVSYVMPLFSVLLVLLVIRTLALDSSAEAIRFLFYPDFSKLQWASLGQAVGHILFTLSVGFGTMVTFGGYLRDSDHIPTAGFRVSAVDTFISLMAGLLVFPIVFQMSPSLSADPSILFDALPRFFGSIPFGVFFGFCFFVCLYMAAVGASLGLMEVVSSNVSEQFKIPRSQSVWIAGATALALAVLPALSSNVLKDIRIFNLTILESFDSFFINWALPVVGLLLSLVFGFGMKETQAHDNFVDPEKIESVSLFGHWRFALRYLIPVVILSGLIGQVLGFFA